jgi:hypothetical protein
MPKVANGIDLDGKPARFPGENLEVERRHGRAGGRPGVVRLLAYANDANMGSDREAVAAFLAAEIPCPTSKLTAVRGGSITALASTLSSSWAAGPASLAAGAGTRVGRVLRL